MRRTPALPWASTDLAISITAFSWEWAPGPVGVITTAGATIVLAAVAEEGIPAEVAPRPIAGVTEALRQRAATAEAHPRPTPGPRQPFLMLRRRAVADRRREATLQQPTVPTPVHRAVVGELAVEADLPVEDHANDQ